MKNALLLIISLTMLWSCSQPSAHDMVRQYRREYPFTFQFIVSSSDELSVSIDIQNKSGDKNLQDITVIVEASDEAGNVFWTKTKVLDVTGLGNYATKEITFKETVPESSAKLQGLNIYIAPDGPDSGFEKYREFMRVGS